MNWKFLDGDNKPEELHGESLPGFKMSLKEAELESFNMSLAGDLDNFKMSFADETIKGVSRIVRESAELASYLML